MSRAYRGEERAKGDISIYINTSVTHIARNDLCAAMLIKHDAEDVTKRDTRVPRLLLAAQPLRPMLLKTTHRVVFLTQNAPLGLGRLRQENTRFLADLSRGSCPKSLGGTVKYHLRLFGCCHTKSLAKNRFAPSAYFFLSQTAFQVPAKYI